MGAARCVVSARRPFQGRRFTFLVGRMPKIVILCGPSGSGKTTICSRVLATARQQRLSVAGILTRPRIVDGQRVGLDAEDVRTGEVRPLADWGGMWGEPCGRWRFSAEALDWGAGVLRRSRPSQLLLVDELGPLELVHGQGWCSGLETLHAGEYEVGVVVVRPGLLARLCEALAGAPAELITMRVTPDDREGLPRRILAILMPGGARADTLD